ncbi:unnamed protein product [Ixodes pacificus]
MCVSASFRAFVSAAALYDYKPCSHTRCALPVCYATIARVLIRQREASRACPDKYLPLVFQYTTRVMASFAIFVSSSGLFCCSRASRVLHCCVPSFIIRVALFGQWWVMSLQFK